MGRPFDIPVMCPIVIGRTTELSALHSLIEHTKSGEGQVVLLAGEAGIGKSRLVTEAKAYATTAGFLSLQGQCFPADRSCPYAPLLDLLRTYFAKAEPDRVATELGPLAALLFALLPDLFSLPSDLPALPALDAEQEKQRLFATLRQFLLRKTSQQPLLFIVEDLHWSDDTSLEFLQHLARHCTDFSILLLLTYRSEEVHPGLRQFLAHLDRQRLTQEYFLHR